MITGTRLRFFLLVGLFSTVISSTVNDLELERFDEVLRVRPVLKDQSKVAFQEDMVVLQYEFNVRSGLDSSTHFNLFPRTVGILANDHGLEDLHISLTRGEWDVELWGEEIQPSPTGAEMWVKFLQEDVDSTKFNKLTRALAGLLCIEFNGISEAKSVQPKWNQWNIHQYGLLPRETSCNENLSHLLKLTPSRTQQGFARFVKTVDVLRSPFHALGFRFRKVCLSSAIEKSVSECSSVIGSEFTVKLTYILSMKEFKAWELTNSPLATSSAIEIQNKEGSVLKTIDWSNSQKVTDVESSPAPKDVLQSSLLLPEIKGSLSEDEITAVQIEKIVTEIREVSALITIRIRNNNLNRSEIRLVEIVPSFLRTRFNSLNINSNERDLSRSEIADLLTVSVGDEDGMSHHRLLELDLILEGGSAATISYRVDKRFLRLELFPADPNRGFDIPSSLLWYREMSSTNKPLSSRWKRTYSQGLLLLLPLPDFSMPYNVITLSTTMIAFVFGSYVNVMARRRKVGTAKS